MSDVKTSSHQLADQAKINARNILKLLQAEKLLAERDEPCVWTGNDEDSLFVSACAKNKCAELRAGQLFCDYCGHPIQIQESSDD